MELSKKEKHRLSQQKYQQSDAYKKYQQKYQQSDAYKKYRQKYQQSDAYKKSQQKYQQSDAYKKYQQKYQQSDAYKNRKTISNLKELYSKQLQKTISELKKFRVPPIALEGKYIMLKEILNNLDIIEKHTENLDSKIKQKTIETMINQLLEKEGILVSRRAKLSPPLSSPSLKTGVSRGAD